MPSVSINLSGMTELKSALLALPKNLQKRTLRRVLRKQSNRVLARIKTVIPREDAPHLGEVLKVYAGKTTNKGAVLRDGIGFPTREELGIAAEDNYYWPFALEYGHASPGRGTYGGIGYTPKGQQKPRRKKNPPKDVAPRPYIRRSWDQLENVCGQDISATAFAEIERTWTRVRNRTFDTSGQLDRDLALGTSEASLG